MPQPALDTRSAPEALTLRVESIESKMDGMATRSDLKVMHAEIKAALEILRADMSRMICIQTVVLGLLIVGLATIMLGLRL